MDELAAPPTPVFFLAGGTGISAETLGNLMLAQFPSASPSRGARSRSSPPWSRPARWWPSSTPPSTDSVTALVFSTVSDEEIRHGAATHRVRVHRPVRVAPRHGRAGAARQRHPRRRGPARRRRHPSLRPADAGHRVRDGARRRCQPAQPRAGRPDPRGALTVRQDADLDVPRPPARPQGRQLPARRRGLRLRRPAAARSRTSAPSASACSPPPPGSARCRGERRPGSTYASLAQCSFELRRAEALYRLHRIPSINSASMSVEEMAAVIMQTSRLGNLA